MKRGVTTSERPSARTASRPRLGLGLGLVGLSLLGMACGSVTDALPAVPTSQVEAAQVPASDAAPLLIPLDEVPDGELPFDEGDPDEQLREDPEPEEQLQDDTEPEEQLQEDPEPGEPPEVTLAGGDEDEVTSDGRLVDGIPVASEGCFVTANGRLETRAVLVNNSDRERDVVVEFAVIDPDGLRVADGFDVITDVASGQRFLTRDTFSELEGFTSPASEDVEPVQRERSITGWSCQVIRVTAA